MLEEHAFCLMPEPSWILRIFVSNLQVERTLRVKGDMHIGGVMLKLVEELNINDIDWSDHALWWPKKNCWLHKTRQTLNHYGLQADSFLYFTPMHKPLRVQLPDLRYVDANVNFSVDVFNAIKLLCKELGIRHSEELSFCRPLSTEHLKKNYQNVGVTPKQRTNFRDSRLSNTSHYGSLIKNPNSIINGKMSPYTTDSGTSTIDTRAKSPDITSTLSRHASYRGFTTTYSTSMLVEDLKNLEISNSPHNPSSYDKNFLLYPKSLVEKARLNAGWLDSHLSLYQQNVRDHDILQLRFKYSEFYDLNPKLDMARINQIYEQAKWSLLTGEIKCSQEQMRTFASLQYQIQQQASNPILEDIGKTNDDIDTALTELQLELEGRLITTFYNSATQCKLNYIKAWKALPDYGIHMFIVKFAGSKREEILGIASDRLIRIDPSNGNHLRVWPYAKMKTWQVNWDSKQVQVECKDDEILFSCLSADCKLLHEFIGGYVFLSMRSKDSSQNLNENLFYKLTRGWDDQI